MQYNKCETCGADGGRCGMMIRTEKHKRDECLNCHKTRKTGIVTIDANLDRTEKEIQLTIAILTVN